MSLAQQSRIGTRGDLNAGEQLVVASMACESPQEHTIAEDSTPRKVGANGG